VKILWQEILFDKTFRVSQ